MNPFITIAVALHKGGVGKTVTALALSSGLARAGKRTLLVDLDPQGHSTVGGDDIDFGPADLTLRDHLGETGKPLRDPGPLPYARTSGLSLEASGSLRPRRLSPQDLVHTKI